MFFSNGNTIIELVHEGAIELDFYQLFFNFIEIKKYQILPDKPDTVDFHYLLLDDINGDILVILTPLGELIHLYNEVDLKSEIRREKISHI